MKRIILILLLIFVSAWNWPTHESFSVKIYDSFPSEVKSNLNLTLVKEGSLIPDKIIQDYDKHSYPNSVERIDYWLTKSYDSYLEENYTLASLSLGIASHYISDSFSAPHNTANEDYSMHSKFETEAEGMPFYAQCTVGKKDVDAYISKAAVGKTDWGLWLRNKANKIQSKELSKALYAGYALSHAYYSSECYQPLTSKISNWFKAIRFRFS